MYVSVSVWLKTLNITSAFQVHHKSTMNSAKSDMLYALHYFQWVILSSANSCWLSWGSLFQSDLWQSPGSFSPRTHKTNIGRFTVFWVGLLLSVKNPLLTIDCSDACPTYRLSILFPVNGLCVLFLGLNNWCPEIWLVCLLNVSECASWPF